MRPASRFFANTNHHEENTSCACGPAGQRNVRQRTGDDVLSRPKFYGYRQGIYRYRNPAGAAARPPEGRYPRPRVVPRQEHQRPGHPLPHRIQNHWRPLGALREHRDEPHGLRGHQGARPLQPGRRQVAVRMHGPASRKNHHRQDYREPLGRGARVPALPAALRRRAEPRNRRRLRRHHHQAQLARAAARQPHRFLRHQHHPGRLRLAPRHGVPQHPLAVA